MKIDSRKCKKFFYYRGEVARLNNDYKTALLGYHQAKGDKQVKAKAFVAELVIALMSGDEVNGKKLFVEPKLIKKANFTRDEYVNMFYPLIIRFYENDNIEYLLNTFNMLALLFYDLNALMQLAYAYSSGKLIFEEGKKEVTINRNPFFSAYYFSLFKVSSKCLYSAKLFRSLYKYLVLDAKVIGYSIRNAAYEYSIDPFHVSDPCEDWQVITKYDVNNMAYCGIKSYQEFLAVKLEPYAEYL